MNTLGRSEGSLALRFAAMFLFATPAILHGRSDCSAAQDLSEREQAESLRAIHCQVSGKGGPLAGATATVTLSFIRSVTPAATNTKPGTVLKVIDHTTDATGRYWIKVPDALAEMPQLHVTVTLTHPEYLDRTIGPVPLSGFRLRVRRDQPHWSHGQLRGQAMLHSVLRQGRRIEGRVLLPDGAAAVGAKVQTATKYQSYAWKFPDPQDYRFRDSTVTDKDGRFSVRADRQTSVTVTMSGHAPLIVDDYDKYAWRGGDPANTFRLPKGIRVSGRVLDGKGEPIPRAIVSASRDFEWNESDMPLVFGRSCAANEKGEYKLPPLPAERYKFVVNSRLSSDSDRAAFNASVRDVWHLAHFLHSSADKTNIQIEPLDILFVDSIRALDDSDESHLLDLREHPVVTVGLNVEFPDGPLDPKQVHDVMALGTINDRRWFSPPVKLAANGPISLVVAKGLQDVRIRTGLALLRRSPSDDFDIGRALPFNRLDADVDGITVVKPKLATLDVTLALPGELSQEYRQSNAKVWIQAHYLREGFGNWSAGKERLWVFSKTVSPNRELRATGTALPNEPIVLTASVQKGEDTNDRNLLHKEQLTLAPGETRERSITVEKALRSTVPDDSTKQDAIPSR